MKCVLHIQLEQRAYLADIRGETVEAKRLRQAITTHVEKCAVCRGLAEATTLAEQLFGLPIRKEQIHE